MGVNLVTGEFTTFNDDIWPAHTNAWGYNRTDDLMWGVEIGAATDTLLRVGSDWEIDEIEFDGDNTLAWVYSGDFDANGVLHTIGLDGNQTFRVDVNPGSEDYLTQLDDLILDRNVQVSDWAFSSVDDQLYAIEGLDGNTLIEIDPDDGAVTDLGVLESADGEPAPPVDDYWGGAFTDADGNFYMSHNTTGQIWVVPEIHEGNTEGELLSTGEASENNDGARCAEAPSVLDPLLHVTKVADTDGPVDLGDEIEYTITVENAGNVDLVGVEVEDPLLDDLVCTDEEGPVDLPADLASGEELECTGTYEVTEDDVGEDAVVNVATASATDPTDPEGDPIEDDGSVTVPTVDPNPGLAVEKTADTEGPVDVGDTIGYAITATNTGNVTITDVEVEDPLIEDLVCDDAMPATLAPGSTLECEGTYEVTEGDADGEVVNTAVVTSEELPPEEDSVTVPVDPLPEPDPEITAVKTADPEDPVEVGDTIDYTIRVTNTGEVEATGIEVSDPLIDDLVCEPETPADLAAGDVLECIGSYEVTEADADAGSVINTAVVTGDDVPEENPSVEVPVDDPEDPEPVPGGELTVEKTSEGPDEVFPGDLIDYTITVTNTGDVDVTNVEVSDPLIEDLACDPDTPADLAPGDVLVCEGDYEVTDADADASEVVNTAVAIGEGPDGDEVSDDDSDVNPIGPLACLPSHPPVEELVRLSGETRVDTTIAVSQERWIEDCDYDAVVLTRADVYADSLSGTPLAAELESPILITASNELYDHVADEITRLMPDGGTVYMLGGYAALDENVEEAVEDLGYDITRLGGPSRFETAGLIAEYLLDRDDRDHVLIADGTDHSDALVAGTAGAANNGTVLLTPGEHTHQVVDEFLAEHDTPPMAIGVSAEAYPDLDAIVGQTRDHTAVQVAEEFFDEPTHVGVARSDDFPDALGGGAHIGGYGGPLVLTHTDQVPEATAEYLESIPLVGGYAYGGTHAIDEETFEEIGSLMDR